MSTVWTFNPLKPPEASETYYSPHSTDEDPEAQRCSLTCLWEHGAGILTQSAISLAQCTTLWAVRKDRSPGPGHVGEWAAGFGDRGCRNIQRPEEG